MSSVGLDGRTPPLLRCAGHPTASAGRRGVARERGEVGFGGIDWPFEGHSMPSAPACLWMDPGPWGCVGASSAIEGAGRNAVLRQRALAAVGYRLELVEDVRAPLFIAAAVAQRDGLEACAFVEPSGAGIGLEGVEPDGLLSGEGGDRVLEELSADASARVAGREVELVYPA